jgi:hypothetical protein
MFDGEGGTGLAEEMRPLGEEGTGLAEEGT